MSPHRIATLSLFTALLALPVLAFTTVVDARPARAAEPVVASCGQTGVPPCPAGRPVRALALQSQPLTTTVALTSTVDVADVWSAPVNLSRSGGAADPQVVKDARERLHVIWQDAANEFMYVNGAGDSWSEPVAVELPFGTREYFPDLALNAPTPLFRPTLVADAGNQIHAFWLDDIGDLYHSQVDADELDSFDAWSAPVLLAEGTLALDVTAGLNNALHVSYIRFQDTADEPAGVYYTTYFGDGANPLPSTLLYPSAYFRSLPAESANVQIAATASGQILVAWDNRSLEKVFLVTSANGGVSWAAPIEMDGRQATDSPEAAGPSGIILGVSGSNVLALWDAAHEDVECALHYNWSADGGITWQEKQRLDAVQGCPQESALLTVSAGDTLLMTAAASAANLVAWDWDTYSWSDPQVQEALSIFPNSETHRQVSLGCHQALLGAEGLYVAGCDTGGGQDIWVLSRPLDALDSWFAPPAVWQTPQAVPASGSTVQSPSLVADAGGRLHAFWGQLNGPAIHHAIWESGRWTNPTVIFNSPAARVGAPAATASQGDRLAVAWGDTQTGQIYLIQAAASQAILESDWSSPVELPQPAPGAASPDVFAGRDGRITVAYAIPVNEERGVYVTWSDDQGGSWAEPVRAFDGVAAGWAMVGAPHLAVGENGQIHVVWTQHTMPGGAGTIGLYYAHTTDAGNSWSQPAEIAAAPVTWAGLAATGEQTVHVIWKEAGESSTILRHVRSVDSGATWSMPTTIPGEAGQDEPVALAGDSAGHLSLLYSSFPFIQHWLWDGERWSRDEDLALDKAVAIGELAAAVVSDGSLGLLYSNRQEAQTGAAGEDSLFFASRMLEDVVAPVVTGPPPVSVTQAPTPEASIGEPLPSPVATIAQTTLADVPSPSSRETAVASGIVPAGLVVVFGFALGVWLVRRRRH